MTTANLSQCRADAVDGVLLVDDKPAQKKRIAFISPSWPPSDHGNGIVSYVGQMQASLGELGHKAFVASSKMDSNFSDRDLAFQIRPWHPRFCRIVNAVGRRVTNQKQWINSRLIGLRRAVEHLCRTHKIELVEMEESFGIAGDLTRRASIPVVVRLHGPWFFNGRANGVAEDAAYHDRVRRERVAIESAAGISAPSHAILNEVRQHYGLALPDARMIANPIRVVPLTERWRASTAETDTILFVGRFDTHKGGDVAIQAFAYAASQRRSARLIFIGEDRGITTSRNQRVGITDFAKDYLSPSALQGFTYLGRQPQNVIDHHRRRAAVTVVASRLENCPYALLEAMRLGAPVVATNVGGIPEIIQDGKTGVLVPPSDPSRLADGILRLLDNPTLAAEMGAAAAVDIANRFNPVEIAKQSIDFYSEVIARWGTRR